jgi:hypothetical protein
MAVNSYYLAEFLTSAGTKKSIKITDPKPSGQISAPTASAAMSTIASASIFKIKHGDGFMTLVSPVKLSYVESGRVPVALP